MSLRIFILLSLLGSFSPVSVLARTLAAQPSADLMKLRGSSRGTPPLAEIREPARIAAITAFINRLPDKWSVPWYGAPVGQIYFEFFKDGKFVGNFYIGPGFFGRDRGGFYSQRARPPQLAELSALVGFDVSPYVTRPPARKPESTARE